MTVAVSDRIEKRVVLRAPQSRVWRAITNADEFGTWFGCRVQGAFVEGKAVRANITTPGYDHLTMELQIERIEPERYFAYRWHPYDVDLNSDYSKEVTTLVEFRLEETTGQTTLTIVESGFDRVPLERRAKAFCDNEGGWSEQVRNIERYVTQSS
jgi:uncharacterized protein YndB with AHSA1/START domain